MYVCIFLSSCESVFFPLSSLLSSPQLPLEVQKLPELSLPHGSQERPQAGTCRLTLRPCSGPDREAQRNMVHTGAMSTQQPLGRNYPEWEMTTFRRVLFSCCRRDLDPRGSGKLKLLRSFCPPVILLARPFAPNSVCVCLHTLHFPGI